MTTIARTQSILDYYRKISYLDIQGGTRVSGGTCPPLQPRHRYITPRRRSQSREIVGRTDTSAGVGIGTTTATTATTTTTTNTAASAAARSEKTTEMQLALDLTHLIYMDRRSEDW